MAQEFVQSDVNELLLLASLVDAYWSSGNTELLSEIRLQRQCFGLTPIDRRRLQWQVTQTDEAMARAKMRQTRQAEQRERAARTDDPREALREK